MRHRLLALTAAVLLLASLAPALAPDALAQDPEDGEFSGSILIGFREVDVDGAERKYREDIDLEDGPRLFELSFDLVPAEGYRDFADEVRLDIANFGGDPYETLGLKVRKFGSYDFSYDRRKSHYFYEDIIVPPELADVRLSTGGDFHHFDFDRVRDTADLAINLSRAAKLRFGFERFTKTGESTTTLDVSRDEFELDKPVDESLNTYFAGFEYAWDKATLILEERVRDYENVVEIFLPGFSLGENTAPDSAQLDFFFLDQPYDFTSYDHTARLVLRPTRRWNIRAAATLQDLELDVEADERSQGVGFNGAPFSGSATGDGRIDRDAELFDLDASYLVTDKVSLIAGVRRHSLDQEGEFFFDGTLNEGRWEIDTTRLEGGVSVAVSSSLVVSGGLRFEERDVTHGAESGGGALDLEDETTEQDGYWASLSWRPTDSFRLFAEAEDTNYDDPFTLASPTQYQRARVQGNYNSDSGFWVMGNYQLVRVENDNSGWMSDQDHFTARLGYRRSDFNVSLGYTLIELQREIDQVVVTLPGFGGGALLPFPIFYEADADLIDAHARWIATDRLTLGGHCRFYDNAGSFAVDRTDLKVYADIGFLSDYLLRLGYRTVDYNEDAANFDDYEADIIEVGLGYRW